MSGFLSGSSTFLIESASETTPTPNSIPRSLSSGALDAGWTSIAQTIKVAKSGGDFTSVKEAVDSITDSSTTKNYSIQIYPGVYYEDPFEISTGIALVGIKSGFVGATIVANNNSAHLITMKGYTAMHNLIITGPTTAGYAAVYREDVSNTGFVILKDTQIFGYYGVWDNANAAGGNIVLNTVFGVGSNDMRQFIRATEYGTIKTDNISFVTNNETAVSYGLYAVGENVDVVLISSNYIGNLTSDCAVYVDEGASVTVENATVVSAETAFRVGPGANSFLDISSSNIFRVVPNHIVVESPSAEVIFNGQADRDKFTIAAGSTFVASFLDAYGTSPLSTPGQTIVGELWLGTEEESIPLRSYGVNSYGTGFSSGGELTRGIGLSVNVTSGLGFINTGTGVIEINWNSGSVDLTAHSTNYIYADVNSNLQASTIEPDYSNVVLLGIAYANSVDITFLTHYYAKLPQYRSHMLEYLESVIGPLSATGCTVTKHGLNSPELDVDAGTFYISNVKKTIDGYSAIPFRYWWQDGTGTWQQTDHTTEIDCSLYNTGGALVAVTAGKYKKDLLYVNQVDGTQDYHVVYGQELFDDQSTAEAGNNPGAPDVLSKQSLRLAGVVTLSGDSKVTSLVDSRPVLGQLSTGTTSVSDHGALGGLGDNDHPQYQLRTEQGMANGYPDLDASGLVPAGQLNLAISAPANVTKSSALVGTSEEIARQDHKHDISTAAASTLTASTTDSEGTATSLARSDHLHAISTGTPGTISIGDSASAGTSANLVRADHVHAVTAPAAPANVTKDAASTGVSSTFARADHKHDITTAVPVSVGSSNSEGTATTLARSDHVHAGSLVRTSFTEVTVDTTTVSTVFVDLLSITLTTGANSILIHSTVSSSNALKDASNSFVVTVDGVAARGFGTFFGAAGTANSGSLVYKTSVTAASHTIKLRWLTSAGGTARIRPVTVPNSEHASLLVQEVTV